MSFSISFQCFYHAKTLVVTDLSNVLFNITRILYFAIFATIILNTVQKNSETFLLNQYETPIVIENRLLESSTLDPIEVSNDIEKISSVEGTYYYKGSILIYMDQLSVESQPVCYPISEV